MKNSAAGSSPPLTFSLRTAVRYLPAGFVRATAGFAGASWPRRLRCGAQDGRGAAERQRGNSRAEGNPATTPDVQIP